MSGEFDIKKVQVQRVTVSGSGRDPFSVTKAGLLLLILLLSMAI